MRIAAGIVSALLLASGCMMADAQAPAAEFHIISRDRAKFRGSHVVMREERPGFVAVVYCQNRFWVRPATVAWSEREAENGFQLALETNADGRWRPVCLDPQKQVTTKDLNLPPQVERNLTGSGPVQREFRFQEIRRSFNGR